MSEQLKVIAGAGGGGCFRAGTQVQLEHGETIAIELLKEGDEVLAFDERGEIHLAKVTKLHYHADPQPILRVRFWKGEVFITPNHWVLNQYDSFVEIGRLTTHDALVDGMGHLRPIIDAELVGHEPVWNLTVEPHHTFIADGIRVHNGGHRDRYPVIAGAGGGGGKSKGGRAAIEDPESLQSRAMVSLIDLLGEGQIGGLVNGAKSIFFDDTPLENRDGTRNFEGVSWDFRDGQQIQTPMKGFSDIEAPTVVNVRVTKNQPAVVSITNPNADAVRLLVTIPALTYQDTNTGDTHGSSVKFRFEISTNGDSGAYVPFSGDLTITGKTRSRYQKAYQFWLPKGGAAFGVPVTRWSIKMVRVTDDAKTGNINNETWLDTYTEITNSKLSYPNSVLCGVNINSEQFNKIPTRAYLVDGLYIQVPSNYDPVTRSYIGVWNGTFKVATSSNPAWILYDVLTNKRYGLGQYLGAASIDKGKLYQIGKYCDEMVDNGFGGLEPRFAINTAIQSRVEAYQLITDLCSAFNGMSYWNGGMVGFTQDAPTDPSMIYSQSNVIDGIFQYAGSSRKDRHSVVHVTWSDPEQNYRQAIEYVEDADLVARYGIRKAEVLAFGCTTRGQATRVGKWILYTEAYESDMITFSVGIDSALVMPGDVVKVHDANRAGKRMGGRLKAATRTSATLDAPIKLGVGVSTISIRMPDGSFVDRGIYESGSIYELNTVSWRDPLPDDPVPNAIWLIAEANLEPMLARVIGVAQGEKPGQFVISALEHNPSKYNAIEKGWQLEERKISIIDTKNVAAPGDFTVFESPYLVAPGVLGLSLFASWSGNAMSYEVTWRREGKYATNWESVTTSSPVLDLENVRAGTYRFKIVAISAFGVRSPIFEADYVTLGKTAAPGDVANFKITKRTSDLLLTWDQVTDIALKGYELRVGPSWDSGEVLTTDFAGTMLTHDQDYAGDYYYHIRSINMEDEYSDNVTTVKLTLTAPATVANFDIIQSGSRLELHWRPNVEPDVVYYEIREGNSWNTGTLVSQAKATTFSIPSGGIGIRKFWVKAVASPGIYSNEAAWIDTNIAMPTDSNIVFTADEKLLGWPGNRLNMHIVGYDLMMDQNVARSEYIFPVDLLDSYRAQNSIYATLDSIVYDTDSMNWDTSKFDWDDPESERHWAPGGDIDSVVGKYQIARKIGLRYGEVDGWRLNGTLTSLTGKAATTTQNVTYETGRYSSGVRLRSGVRADWTSLSVPATFNYSLWVIPKLVSDSAELTILEMANTDTGSVLRLGYNEPSGEFRLLDGCGHAVTAKLKIAAGDVVGICIVQTKEARKLFVSKVGGEPASGEEMFEPSGTFNALRLYWT
ncbi:MAG: phage tail protein [Betaproteobacteria bacterium]|nr:phage tail protein [Betaproteobacteria bacterium]